MQIQAGENEERGMEAWEVHRICKTPRAFSHRGCTGEEESVFGDYIRLLTRTCFGNIVRIICLSPRVFLNLVTSSSFSIVL